MGRTIQRSDDSYCGARKNLVLVSMLLLQLLINFLVVEDLVAFSHNRKRSTKGFKNKLDVRTLAMSAI